MYCEATYHIIALERLDFIPSHQKPNNCGFARSGRSNNCGGFPHREADTEVIQDHQVWSGGICEVHILEYNILGCRNVWRLKTCFVGSCCVNDSIEDSGRASCPSSRG